MKKPINYIYFEDVCLGESKSIEYTFIVRIKLKIGQGTGKANS